ncbi:hypothetical protein PYCC9005_000858 [Savitreella phatthalungensis]
MDIFFADLKARTAKECLGLETEKLSLDDDKTKAKWEEHAQMSVLLDKVRELEAAKEILETKNRTLTRAVEERQQVIKARDTAMQQLQDDLHLANLELSQCEQRNRQLVRENDDLVQRWLTRINAEAEASERPRQR